MARAHFYYGLVLAAANRDDEAKKEVVLAEEMDSRYAALLPEDKKSMVMLYGSWGMIEKVAELAVKNIERQAAFPMTKEDYENALRYEILIHNASNSIKIAGFLSQYEDLRDDMNKRFEQVDKRSDQMFTFLWILTGIFTTLTISFIRFSYLD